MFKKAIWFAVDFFLAYAVVSILIPTKKNMTWITTAGSPVGGMIAAQSLLRSLQIFAKK